MDFPRLVYRSAEEHTLAADQEQFDQLQTEGWFPSVPEAAAAKAVNAKETAPAEATAKAASLPPSKKAAASPPAWQKG
jgi:hypothetical protein